jgi:RNA polymerase sigma factor (sigma-70 family)
MAVENDERTDRQLLRSARSDPDAFCIFYDRHVRRLYRWLCLECGDESLALDLTAESFAQALASLHRFRGDSEESAGAWLYAIASHLLSRQRERGRLESRARRRLGIRLRESESFTDEVDERLSAGVSREDLRAALATLPEGQREALQLRVVDDLPYDTVAARLACTPTAARVRVSRALHTLECRLGEPA